MSNRRSSRGPKVEVVRALFIAAGRHHPQYMRPFEINATDDSIEDMLENLGNMEFDTDSLGGWAGDIIGCTSQVDGEDEALIPHGWEGDRLRFFMHVQIPDRTSSDTIDFYVTGFTENDTLYELEGGDLSMSDDTRLFINSIMRLRRTSGRDLADLLGGSSDDRLRIEANSHCLIAYTDDDVRNRSHSDFKALRPYDIAAKLDSNEEEYTMDSRSDFSTSLTKSSSRGNANANHYLGRTVKALYESEREVNAQRNWRDNADPNPYIKAQRILGETDQSKCKLQQLLKRETSYLRNGYLTWKEAVGVFDGLDDERFCSVMNEQEVERRGGGRTSNLDGEKLSGSDMETVASYTALNSITGIMMESCIIQAHFLASVNRRGGIEFSFMRGTAPVFFIKDMTEEQQEENIFLLEQRLKQFVFEPLAHKVDLFELDAGMDVMGDSQLFFSIQGDEPAEFWGATYADGSTSSLLTTRKNVTSNLANDSKRLAEALISR